MLRNWKLSSLIAVTVALAATLVALSIPGGGDYEDLDACWFLGLSGHTLSEDIYRDIPMERQLDMLNELGATVYRVDSPFTSGRSDELDDLIAAAKKRNIQILLILYSPLGFFDDASPEVVREAARASAFRLVSRYRDDIKYWALSNEPDDLAIYQPGDRMPGGKRWRRDTPDGSKPSHYNTAKYEWARAAILGLGEGVREADPDAIRIVNSAGWLHYGFIERLVNDRVPFEILAWHWYSEMGDITSVGEDEFDLLSRLEEFGKPIWITEGNRREGGPPGQEKEQADYLADTIHRMASLFPRIRGYFVYELLDEPFFGPKNRESHYGLSQVGRGDRDQWVLGRKKEAFAAIAETMQAIGELCED